MTSAQNVFYFSLWGKLKKAVPDAERHAVHAELGLPASHKDWGNAEFDRWKAHCMALSQPGNYVAQLAQIRMPATRRRVFIGHLLAALGQGEEHAERIVAAMNRGRKLGGAFTTLDSLDADQLEKVVVALKLECKRRWPRKDDLLGEIHTVRVDCQAEEVNARAAVMHALNVDTLPRLEKLVYEDLLVVLSALKTMGTVPVQVGVPAAIDPEDVPF